MNTWIVIATLLGVIVLLLVVSSCRRERTAPAPQPQPQMLGAIQQIIAEHLKVDAKQILPEVTFSALGADDLDLVEIIMAVEEALAISLTDESLQAAAGATTMDRLGEHLTVGAFARAVAAAPKARPPAPNPDEPDDGSLHLNQVGSHGELSQLPNPRGHVLVFIPELVELLAIAEQNRNRKLTDTEKADLTAKAVVMAMSAEDAAKLQQVRSERQQSPPQP